jgi:hypothetical protein
MVDLKLTLGKTVHLKNVHHGLTVNKNLISVSLLCHDGYMLVFESKKSCNVQIWKICGQMLYKRRRVPLEYFDYSYNLNIASMTNNKICEDVWHSHFCHIGFDTIARMSLEIIPKFNIMKGCNNVVRCCNN